ncbi:lantibiotic dehydratase [Nocardiopsis sp. RSe5-2]|uniref:Lantibiotic dehydratase n=1 Tax=Nocardiopsis endophytica TaxID=3018445 RepID=A0ABT4U5T1_9ACTN|nr:lantibiotic dehydratase [Nocardiopsis endophytica]MDA2812305.1 lantibiotic dehydratase [Nocardiopsis endophytica]
MPATDPPAVRIAGLPLSALSDLRCPESIALLDACRADRERLTERGALLSDELYPVIGGLADPAARPGLVGLRRAVFQTRVPGAREWNDGIAALLPDGLRDRVADWVTRLRAHHTRLADARGVFEAETRAARNRLREVTADPLFLHALSLSSPPLYAVLRKWQADPGRRPRRKSIDRLVKYVARAAAKTSPNSTFTISGLGRWTDRPATRLPDPGEARVLLETDRLVFERVRDALAHDPRLAGELVVRVNPSATERDGTVRFLAPSRDEPIVSLPASATVAAVLRAVGEHGPLTVSELCAHLGRSGGNPDAVRRYVDKLLAGGLLEAQLPVADQAERPFAELADWLERAAPDGFEACRKSASTLDLELSRTVPPADLDAGTARARAVRETAAALTDAEPDRITLHENAVHTGVPAECALPEWRSALDDLDVVRRWLAVHDPVAPLRLVLGSFLAARFGPGCRLPVVDLQRAIHEEIDGGGPYADELRSAMELAFTTNPLLRRSSGLDRVRELYRLQDEAARALLTEGGSDGEMDGELYTDPARIAAMTDGWPAWIRPPRSLVCFVQQVPGRPADASAHPSAHLVLNAAATGFGRGRNRLHRQLETAGARPEPLGVTTAGDGALTAELAGAFGSGLNRKRPTADRELDYPGVVTAAPEHARIALHDLVVTLDAERELPRLESESLGRPVTPLHLGTMADSLLPPAARLLTHVFGGSYLKHPAVTLLSDLAETGVPDRLVHQPRLRMGHVVLRRASWLVPAGLAPVRGPGERPADHLYRLLDWLHEHGMPRTCFVRALGAALFDQELAAESLPYWAFRKSRKPLYVDAGNPFLVELFDQLAADPDTAVLLIEEALPEPGDAPTAHDGEQRVAEFVVEIPERDPERGADG